MAQGTTPSDFIIETHQLVKNYDAVKALRGIDLTVNEGEIFALLGPNGAGKTTLFSILATLRKPTGGSATVMGYDVINDREAIRSNIGIVFQEPALDSRLKSFDNLRLMGLFYGLGWQESKQRAKEVMNILEIDDFADRPPRKLSGGQKRRLELARAIIAKPRLLFLDEATLGLDVDARRNFWERVSRLSDEGTTIFLTTHYMEEAEIADRIAMINEGNIIALDTPQALKQQVGEGLIRLETENNPEAIEWLSGQNIQADNSEKGILIHTSDAPSLLPEILKNMPQKVIRAEMREPSLEDAFLTLTGKSLQHNEYIKSKS